MLPLVVASGLLLATGPHEPVDASPVRFPTATSPTDRILVESDAGTAVTGVQIFVDAGVDRETPRTNGVASVVAECILNTSVDDASLRSALSGLGGSISYVVDGDSIHFYLEGRPTAMPAMVARFARALAAPDLGSTALAAARATVSARVADDEANALTVAIGMFRRAYYSTAAGLATNGTTASLANLTPADLRAFFTANYRASAVSSAVVGAIDPGLAPALIALRAALPAGAAPAAAQVARPIPERAPKIIARRDINAPWVVVGFAAPIPASRDFGAMLVLERLLGDSFDRVSATTPGFLEKPVGAYYLYDEAPAGFVLYVNGTQIDPSVALRQLVTATKALAVKSIDAPTLARMKTVARGRFLTSAVDLSDRSYLLGTFAAHGLGPDSLNIALAKLDATTPADVRRVAKRYLQRFIVALVLPRTEPVRSN